jgi:hypothetical protein
VTSFERFLTKLDTWPDGALLRAGAALKLCFQRQGSLRHSANVSPSCVSAFSRQ